MKRKLFYFIFLKHGERNVIVVREKAIYLVHADMF